MKTRATLIKKRAAELHILLPRCKEHPELVDDNAAKAEVAADTLLLLLVGLVDPVVVVPVGGDAAVEPAAVVGMPSVKTGVVAEPLLERDVAGTVDESVVDPRAADDDELSGAEIRVIAKAGLVSPESPYKTIR